jgi:hypothetical protein
MGEAGSERGGRVGGGGGRGEEGSGRRELFLGIYLSKKKKSCT